MREVPPLFWMHHRDVVCQFYENNDGEKMKIQKMKWMSLATIIACCSMVMSANAGVIAYVDFGDRDNRLDTGTHGGAYWTTFGWQNSSDSNVTLTDSATDVALPWIVNVTGIEGDSPNSVGPAGHIFTTSDAATDGVWNRPSNAFYITLSGLDATGVEKYDLSLWGNRSNSDDAGVTWEVVGASTVSNTVLQGNTTGVTTPSDFAAVQADGSGIITINMYLPNPADDLSIVSAMSIEAIPEPATLGLVALFGGGILFIRRRLAL
jgi:hypothetical protein